MASRQASLTCRWLAGHRGRFTPDCWAWKLQLLSSGISLPPGSHSSCADVTALSKTSYQSAKQTLCKRQLHGRQHSSQATAQTRPRLETQLTAQSGRSGSLLHIAVINMMYAKRATSAELWLLTFVALDLARPLAHAAGLQLEDHDVELVALV